MRSILSALRLISRILTYASAMIGVVMCSFIILSSIMRYVVGAPFSFSQELVGLLFSAMVFLLLPVAEVEDKHIRVTLVTDALPAAWRRVSDFGSSVLIIAFAISFSIISFDFTALSYRLGAESTMGGLLLYPWMALMPLSSAALGIAVMLRAIERHKS